MDIWNSTNNHFHIYPLIKTYNSPTKTHENQYDFLKLSILNKTHPILKSYKKNRSKVIKGQNEV